MVVWIASILLVVGITIPILVLIYNQFSILARDGIPSGDILSEFFSIVGMLILVVI
jgi:hypothetical protein